MSEPSLFLGRFHPLLVHLPIGLLVAAGGLQGWVWWRRRGGRASRVEAAITPLLGLAAAAAVASAATGWLLGHHGGYSGELFERHRALGLGLAASTLLTASARLVVSWRPGRATRTAYAALLVYTLALLVAVGHVGGALTHGEGYLLEFAPGWLRALSGAEGQESEETPPAQRVVFEALVQPVLARRCVSCHGAEAPRGGLRLDTAEGLQVGGEDGAVLVPGRPGSSPLWRRVSLPPTHPDVMPPGGRRPVTAAEGALLHWWIAEGASFEATLGEAEVSGEVRPIVEALVGPLPHEGPTLPPGSVAPADDASLATAKAAGFSLRPIAAGVSFLQVTWPEGSPGDLDLTALDPLRDQVAWLDLGGTGVSDADLEVVGALRNLVRLDLSRTGVTDSGLAHLDDLDLLETLNLYRTAVTDAGLAHLAGLGSLRRLYLWQTATTPSGVDGLRASLPALEVESGSQTEASESG